MNTTMRDNLYLLPTTEDVWGYSRLMPMILGVGLFLRLGQFFAPLWYDEIFSATLAGLPLDRLITASAGDVHPPTYYLILWVISHTLGQSEWLLRLPSLLAGLALVAVVYHLGYKLRLSQHAIWLATVITAVSPFQIYYSQEARSYALLTLAVAMAAYGLITNNNRLAVLASLAALYLHNMVFLFIFSVWLAIAVVHYMSYDIGKAIEKLYKPALIVFIGWIPGLLWTIRQAGQVGGGYWIPPISSPGRLIATLDDLFWFTLNSPFVLAGGFITAVILVLLVSDLPKLYNPAGLFLLVAVFLPLALVTIASLMWQPVFVSRVMSPIAPFLYLLSSEVITRRTYRLTFFVMVAIPTLLLILVATLLGYTGRPAWDEEGMSMYGQYQPGDAIYHVSTGSYIFWQYYRPDISNYLWPQDTGLSGTLTKQTKTAMGINEATFESVACTRKRWWLIYFHNPTTTRQEIIYVDHLLNDYPSYKVKHLQSNSAVEAWLVRIEPSCDGAATPSFAPQSPL